MKLLFEKNKPGLAGVTLPPLDVKATARLPEALVRRECNLPELSEGEIIRHYTELSRRNMGVDNGFYPLGSCTMKYNPKVNEKLARLSGFTQSHPLAPVESSQGSLELIWELEQALCTISGMQAFTLQPAAGAHGELTGLLIIRAWFRQKGEERKFILAPDTSHGTNPASAAMCGFKTITLHSNKDGGVDMDDLKRNMSREVAGLMLTTPNTLGLFDKNILKIAAIVHAKGGLMYGDGANANALLGITRFRDMGFDLIHLNLHKTFSTPHGGGGPGAGPVGVTETLKDYLPGPLVARDNDRLSFYTPKHSIGRVKAFYGNFSIFVRAYAYIRALGATGLLETSQAAVLNANYLRKKLESEFHIPYNTLCKHEFVMDDSGLPNGITTMDVAKRLLDFGFHPPTVYFPLIVKGAIMIEPTETESRETLDAFVQALQTIKREAGSEPETVKNAPHTTVVSRLNEVLAARKPLLRYKKGG